jgi:two-component sensor histidine kinase
LISAFIDGQAAEMEFIRSQLSSAEISSLLVKREEARISRELAKYLHGTIQSRLMASAMEVERAGRSGDKSAIDREIAKAYKTLTLPDESYFSAPEETLEEELKKVAAKWNHLLKIRISLSKNLPELESNISQDIGNVVNEALANSFRHGEATSVSITITKIKNDVLIQISDNGVGISKGKPGLGTDAFTALAGSAWKLTKSKNGSGTLLTLRLENVFS